MKFPFLSMRSAPLLALLSFALAACIFGVLSPAFSHRVHPLALLGAQGEPMAWVFNALGFLLPGGLLAWQALRLRARMGQAGWAARIGVQLALLSALAFAAQGALPLDPYNLLAPASRLHALAWTLWWVAFVPGAMLVAGSAPERRLPGFAFALLVPLLALFGTLAMPAAIAQRIAYLLWFGWWLLVASRGAASAPGSSPPART